MLHHIGDATSLRDVKSLESEINEVQRISHRSDQAVGARKSYVAVHTDVTASGAADKIVRAAEDSFGGIDVLVNNAGICQFSEYQDVTKEKLDRHMAVNYTAPFLITQRVAKLMVEQQRGGSVVSVSSITALLGSSMLTHYSPTKAAILGMTVSNAVALGKHGIRFNAVCPGTIETSMNKADLAASDKRPQMIARVPMGRLGMPDDIAGAIVFFASDLAKYITGQHIVVDGGAFVSYQ